MTLQISPIGVVIITVFYLIGAGALALLARWLRGWRPRPFVLIPIGFVLLALPWVDEVYIAYRFAKLCEDAGVQVIRRVEVEGFYDDTMRSGYELIDKYGYRFMEHPSSKKGKVGRVEKIDGKWRETELDKPTARYTYKFAGPNQEVLIGYRLEKTEEVVIDSETGEVIARDVHYSRYPGWVEGLWVRFFGTGRQTCKGSAPKPPELRHLLYHYVLTPADKTN